MSPWRRLIRMPPLQRIEVRVLQLLPSLNMRPTIDRSAELGELLTEAKAVVSHGRWLPWLQRVQMNDRTARLHMEVFRESANRNPDSDMTIKQFLAFMRQSRINSKRAEREVNRAECAARLGALPDSIQLHNCDSREFLWPMANAILTDPPWADMDCFRWLAGMASQKLVPGGVMLLQCGTAYLPQVMRIMEEAGLTYNWLLAVVYAEMRGASPTGARFLSAWKPTLFYSQGPLGKASYYIGDVYTLTNQRQSKKHHAWEQSPEPTKYYAERLIAAGSLVLDPFAGSGTTGVVAKELGMKWIGTEIDETSYKVARGRLSEAVEVKEPLTV